MAHPRGNPQGKSAVPASPAGRKTPFAGRSGAGAVDYRRRRGSTARRWTRSTWTRMLSGCCGLIGTFHVAGTITEGTRRRAVRPERSHSSPARRVASRPVCQVRPSAAVSTSSTATVSERRSPNNGSSRVRRRRRPWCEPALRGAPSRDSERNGRCGVRADAIGRERSSRQRHPAWNSC